MIYYLDTETTGLNGADEVIELALIDDAGSVIIDTLLRPVDNSEWEGAEVIHGISPDMVLRDDLPTLADKAQQLTAVLSGQTLVVYRGKNGSMLVLFDSGRIANVIVLTKLLFCSESFF